MDGWASHITRDALLVGFVVVAASYEILFGGARPAVLTFLTGILLSPLALRVDERARHHNAEAKP